MRIVEELYSKNNSTWAESYTRILNNLGDSYSVNDEEKGMALLKKCCEIRKKLYLENKSLWVEAYSTTLSNLGMLYIHKKNIPQAQEILKKFIDISQDNTVYKTKSYEALIYKITDIYKLIAVEDFTIPNSKNTSTPNNQITYNKKIGRNTICPYCNSGKKYKKCCGKS